MPGAFDYEEVQEVLRDGSVRPRWRKKKPAGSSSARAEAGSAGAARPIIVVNNRHFHQISDVRWP